MNKSIFKKSAVEHISSPEQLNDYIKVADPGVWITLAAIIVLTAALLIWGFLGSMSTSYTVKGLALENGSLDCYIDPTADIKPAIGMEVAVTDGYGNIIKGKISALSSTPLSYEEVENSLEASDYAKFALGLSDWNIAVRIDVTDTSGASTITAGSVYSMSITTESINPIEMIFG